MAMTFNEENEAVRELTSDLKSGHLTRGAFVTKALAMGLSVAVADRLLNSNPAFAASPAERALQREAAGKTYQYWTPFAGDDGPHMKLMVDRYNSANRGTYFNYVRVGGGYETKMTSAAISHTLPDVAAYRADWIPDAVARHIFEPIDDLATANHIGSSDFNPQVWQAGAQAGHRYAIPLDTHVAVFYYNNDILAKAGLHRAPTNKAEFDAALAAVKKTGNIAFPVSINWPLPVHFCTFLWQQGGSLFSSDGNKCTWNSPQGQRALQYIVDIVNSGASTKNITDEGQVAFLTKKAAMWIDGIWWLQGVKDAKFNYGAAPTPYIFGKAAWTGSHQMVLPTKSRSAADRAALGKFISYIVSNSVEWAKGGQVPASAAVRESAAFKAVQPQATIATEEPYVQLVGPKPGQSAAFYNSFTASAGQAVAGKMSVKAALDQSVALGNKLLASSRAAFGSGNSD
jgi:multiple sugar transport system substrate-binding protein